WLLVGGEKMSKSKLNGIAPAQIIDHFGSDAFRYYFMRAITFGQDGSFSWEDMTARYHGDLANGLGNLASRVAAMVGKYFDGRLPRSGAPTALELELEAVAARAVADAEEAIDHISPNDAINAIWTLVDAANHYITDTQPWQVAKDPEQAADGGRLATILVTTAEALRSLAILLNPVTPKACAGLWDLLGAAPQLGALAAQPTSAAAGFGVLEPGTVITKGDALFPRLEDVDFA
ncbi:MAG: class I tRNA ligase family protein, partial [Cellulomonadaceae bacterium]